MVTCKRASGERYPHGLCLALYSVLIFVDPLPRYGTVPFVPAVLTLLVFLPSGRSKVWEKMTSLQLYGESKWRFARCFKPDLVAASTFLVRRIGLFFEGFWIDLCSSSCNPWLMITYLITCSFIFLSQRHDLEVLYKSVQVDAPCAAQTASLVSGVRAPPVSMSGTVGVRSKPAWHLWKNEPQILEKLQIRD